MPTHTYEPPVDALLHCGECEGTNAKDWPNYVDQFGLTADHVPALIQMLQDEELWAFFEGDYKHEDEYLEAGIEAEEALWAPLHAWRSLGQLQAIEAIAPLAKVLERYDFDWCWEEIPQVLGLMGEAAIAPLEDLLATKINYNNKITLVEGLGSITKTFPDLRDRTVAALTRLLDQCQTQHRSVNGALIAQLLDLKAVEAVPTIEAAYAAKKVDEMFTGSWAQVQVDLGLKQRSDFTDEELAPHYTPRQEEMMANIRALVEKQKAPPPIFPPHLDTKPPQFSDIVTQTSAPKLTEKSGFGGAASGAKKRKKKKK